MPEPEPFRIFARSAGRDPLDPEAHVFAQSLAIQAVYGRFLDMGRGDIIRPGIVRAVEWDSRNGRLTLSIDTGRLSHIGKRLSAWDVRANIQRYVDGKDSIINLYALRGASVPPIAPGSNEVSITGIPALTPAIRALSHPLIRIFPGGEDTKGLIQCGWGDFKVDRADKGLLRLTRVQRLSGHGPDRVEICTGRGPYEFDFGLWPVAETTLRMHQFQKVQVDSLAGTYCLVFNFENRLMKSQELRCAMHRGLDMAAVVDCSTPGSRHANLLIPQELIGEYSYKGGFEPTRISSSRDAVTAVCGAQTVTGNVYYGPSSSNSGRDKMSAVMEEIGLNVKWLGTVSSQFLPEDESLFMVRNVCARRSDPFAMVTEFLDGSPLSSQVFPRNGALTELCNEYQRLDDPDAIDRQLRRISTFISHESLAIPFAVRDVHGLLRNGSGYQFVPNGNGIYCDLECFQRRNAGN